jgi:predicted HAD superfamily Cof-like phosphohydrolase
MSAIQQKSYHQQQVEAFMLRAGQKVPVVPSTPSPEDRVLRARLILEEALETIEALGVDVTLRMDAPDPSIIDHEDELEYHALSDRHFNMVEVIDGCCDIRVVTTGTLSALGIPDEPFQQLVDRNNLYKFGPGSYTNEHGKLVKPANHPAPNIAGLLGHLQLASDIERRKNDENPYAARSQVNPDAQVNSGQRHTAPQG